MSELSRRGVRDYSELGFGECLGKVARNQLALLCLKAIRDEIGREPILNKSKGRGRPTEPRGILAIKMGVHPDSVRRWMDLREVQASDLNAERLAEMAYAFDPIGVAQILREDIARRRMAIDVWLKKAEANYPAPPYVKNTDVEEGA